VLFSIWTRNTLSLTHLSATLLSRRHLRQSLFDTNFLLRNRDKHHHHNVPRRLPTNPLPRNPHPTRPSLSKSSSRKETYHTSPSTTNTTKTYNDKNSIFCIIQFLPWVINNITISYSFAFAWVAARVEDGGLVWCVA